MIALKRIGVWKCWFLFVTGNFDRLNLCSCRFQLRRLIFFWCVVVIISWNRPLFWVYACSWNAMSYGVHDIPYSSRYIFQTWYSIFSVFFVSQKFTMLLPTWVDNLSFFFCRDHRSSRTSLLNDLEEGGLRSSSSYSHDINEHDNDKAVETLEDRVIFLKRVSSF